MEEAELRGPLYITAAADFFVEMATTPSGPAVAPAPTSQDRRRGVPPPPHRSPAEEGARFPSPRRASCTVREGPRGPTDRRGRRGRPERAACDLRAATRAGWLQLLAATVGESGGGGAEEGVERETGGRGVKREGDADVRGLPPVVDMEEKI
jgi:hypothetical protein